MRKLFIITSAILLLGGCSKTLYQVCDTSSKDLKLANNAWVFENDTIKVIYSFWDNKGIMSFSIYNKLNKPIYIDWKNSSFIYNDLKLNYWSDEIRSNSIGKSSGYSVQGPATMRLSSGIQNSTSVTIKPERETFIPPKSLASKALYNLKSKGHFDLSINSKLSVVPLNDNPKKTTKEKLIEYSYDNSPLRFRNYLAISLSENSNQFFYIDNEFYLAKVLEIDEVHFIGKSLKYDNNGKPYLYKNRYQKGTSFYLFYQLGK